MQFHTNMSLILMRIGNLALVCEPQNAPKNNFPPVVRHESRWGRLQHAETMPLNFC